jgi:hypothetical protein
MSHYAQLDENNIVVFVIHAKSDGKENEFTENTGEVWKQTSYNTYGGVHYTTDEEGNRVPSEDQTKALRKNYAGIGFTYDEERDAFIPPQPFPSWILDEDTCLWEAPIPYPGNGEPYIWNEETGAWEEIANA